MFAFLQQMFEQIFEFLLLAKFELMIFALAAGLHHLLFSDRSAAFYPRSVQKKLPDEDSLGPGSEDASKRLLNRLLKHVRPLLRSNTTREPLAEEIKKVLSKQADVPEPQQALAAMIKSLERSVDVELLAAVRSVVGNEPLDMKLAKQLFRCYTSLDLREPYLALFAEVEKQCEAEGKTFPSEIAVTALQLTLSDQNLEAALSKLHLLAWAELDGKLKTSMLRQLAKLAGKQGAVDSLLNVLDASGVAELALECVLFDASQRQDDDTMDKANASADRLGLVLTPASRCCLLVRAATDESMLESYESQFLDVDVLTVHSAAGNALIKAALNLNRDDILTRLLEKCDDNRKAAVVKAHAGHLEHAKRLFNACPEKSAQLHNALLNVALGSGNAEDFDSALDQAAKDGVMNVVTYNTIIKAHLQKGDISSARKVMSEMEAAGSPPNVVTFNELLDAFVNEKDAMWLVFGEMQKLDIKPNKVTCSILLKSLSDRSPPYIVERVMAIVDDMEDRCDEILLGSISEACIRTGRADLLRNKFTGNNVKASSPHAIGSLIRGSGFIKDLRKVWSLWTDMKTRGIQPTGITLGCMVEALVNCGALEQGYRLLREASTDPATKPLVNSVMYGSILKGFCHQGRFDEVWSIYEEMRTETVKLSSSTFNALLDACARSKDLKRVQPLLEEMHKQGLTASKITYSTVLKCYCSENRMTQAFKLFEEMQTSTTLQPDEVSYNILLDGCARYGLFDKGVAIIDSMRAAGVNPSNFTLSVVAKLCIRSNRCMKAFAFVSSLSEEFGITLNVHVYNNLIQASVQQNDLNAALETLATMLAAKVSPDVRTYTLLLDRCKMQYKTQACLEIFKSAAGLSGGHSKLKSFGMLAALRKGALEFPTAKLTEIVTFICTDKTLVQDILNLGVSLPQKVVLSITGGDRRKKY